jgi:16S rRNA (adenine1518-N6/adenine1519-N6)-dimethyltransferase
MAEIEFEAQKGQHLLKDKTVLSKEVGEAMLSKDDRVIEIGAGTGILTERLAQKSGEVLAFEIDEAFKESLEKIKERHDNLKIVYGNALDYSWKGYNKIVANIPYTLSQSIIQKAIKEKIETLVLIVSSQFKDTLLSDEKLGITANLFFDIELIVPVSRKAFFPAPKIESFMIRLKRKKPESKIDDILRGILLKEGKIKNALMYSLVKEGKTKNQAREIIENMKIPSETLEKPVGKITGKFLIRLKGILSMFKALKNS